MKKEPPKPVTSVKDAKSDSSFFSAPKPKPKLPSFKKAPPLKKEATADQNVAQPSAVDPFKDALAAMTKARSSPTPVDVTRTPPPALTGPSGKKKKKVSFASEEKLVQTKLIEPAVYDDDVADVSVLVKVDKNYLFIHVILCRVCTTPIIFVIWIETKVLQCTNICLRNRSIGWSCCVCVSSK